MKNFDTLCVMLDCSRNGVMKPETVKHFIDVLSAMGYNSLMLYTEDTYEVEGEPFFGYKRGRYSVAEMREMDDYAFDHGMEIIPCIQTLAHLGSIFHWKDYAAVHDCDDILLAGDEKTYALIGKMFKTLKGCFRSKRIHIGMDEAHMVGRGKYQDDNGYENGYDVLLKHLNRVCDLAKEYGYEPIMWNDMFFKIGRGHYLSKYGPFDAPEKFVFPKEVCDKVPKGVALCYWDYLALNADRYRNMMESSKMLSENLWFAGGVYTTMNFAPHNRLSIQCNEYAIPACIEQGVRNVLLTIWGDVGKDCDTFSTLPGLMHAAALAQEMSPEEMRRKFTEITGEDFDEMLSLDAPDYIYGEDEFVGKANFCFSRFYNDPFLGILDKNLKKPADPAIFDEYAARLHRLADKSRNYAYLYRKLGTLCEVLRKKFDLGERTRALYEAKDKDGLRALANGDYADLLPLLEKFYDAMHTSWDTENKPYGFEIQDIRLGGMIRRIKNCRSRLLDYCDGKTDRIDELEEPVLQHDAQFTWFWRYMVSACPQGDYL